MDIYILKALENIRCGFLDFLFATITFMGEEVFIAIAIGIIFWAVNKKMGELLVYNIFTSFSVNSILKDLVKRPRPFLAIDGFDKVNIDNFFVSTNLADSYSFPSGHSQISSTFFTSLSISLRRNWLYIFSFVFVFLVMLSRLYLGVHYPSDVLIGAIIGVVIPFFWAYIFKKFYNKRLYILLIFSAVMALLLLFKVEVTSFKAIGALLGFAIGSFLEDRFIKFEIKKGVWKKILRIVLGLVVVIAIKEVLKLILPNLYIFQFIRYFLVTFTAFFLYPLLFTKLNF